MKKVLIILCAALTMSACISREQELKRRASELCAYIPDHTLLSRSRAYMTKDFYKVLDTMFYSLPEHEAMDHEWLYYFVTGNGGTIADYEVESVEQTDAHHAVATILVRQKWEDGSFDPESDLESHRLEMERVDGEWLMSDFDGHKADCIRYIANNRKEQALRKAICTYLREEIAPYYRTGEVCIPTLLIVHESDSLVYGDFRIYWYTISGDTLKTVSGGSHAGCMQVGYEAGVPVIKAFEQTEDGAGNARSAKRIFGPYYDVYQQMQSHPEVCEAVRQEQTKEYIRTAGSGITGGKNDIIILP